MSTGNAHNGGMLVPEPTQMETYPSGRFVDLLNPDPETIEPADVIHHLSMTCRYGGGVSRFYSVAEHVALVHDLLRHQGHDELLLPALLHDAAEAFLGDIVSPLKFALRHEEHYQTFAFSDLDGFRGTYTLLTERMDRAIGQRFGVNPALFDHPTLKLADMWALAIEARELTVSMGANWRWPGALPEEGVKPDDVQWIGGTSSELAKARLERRLRQYLPDQLELGEAA